MDNTQVFPIMNAKAVLVTFVLGFAAAGPLPAQMPAACSCSTQLAALADATSSNYAGFRAKAGSPADSIRHQQYLALLRGRAARTLGADCVGVLRSYIAWFQDRHLQVRFTGAGALVGSVPGLGSVPRMHAAAEAAVSRAESDDNDPIVGEWESTSRRTRLRIVPAPAPYAASDRYALVMASPDTAWREGDVYATFVFDDDRGVYHATWYGRGRHPQEWSAVVVGDTLLLSGFNGWHRVAGDPAGDQAANRDPLRPSFRMIAPAAALLTLPSMQVQYAADVDSLVRVHAHAMSRRDLLIIDVRGNETFLLRALQSGKVRIFGQPTAGIVDYLNPAQHEIGCQATLQAPTIRRTVQLPDGGIDNRGIAPHVALPWRQMDPIRIILASYGLAPS